MQSPNTLDLVFFHSYPYKLCVLILELSCFCSFVLCSSYVLSKFLCLFNLYILLCHFCPCHFNVVSSCSMLITAFNLVIVLSILILCSHAHKCLHYHNIFFPIPYFFLVYYFTQTSFLLHRVFLQEKPSNFQPQFDLLHSLFVSQCCLELKFQKMHIRSTQTIRTTLSNHGRNTTKQVFKYLKSKT